MPKRSHGGIFITFPREECSAYVECLLWHHNTSTSSYTLCIEEAQSNVFVKQQCTAKPTFRKPILI